MYDTPGERVFNKQWIMAGQNPNLNFSNIDAGINLFSANFCFSLQKDKDNHRNLTSKHKSMSFNEHSGGFSAY